MQIASGPRTYHHARITFADVYVYVCTIAICTYVVYKIIFTWSFITGGRLRLWTPPSHILLELPPFWVALCSVCVCVIPARPVRPFLPGAWWPAAAIEERTRADMQMIALSCAPVRTSLYIYNNIIHIHCAHKFSLHEWAGQWQSITNKQTVN
jgi:hypothetical protein